MVQRVQLTAAVSENRLGQRLDQALAEIFLDYSRSRIKEWTLDQRVLINDKVCDKPKEKVLGGEQMAISTETKEGARFEPQDIPLDIVYEDEDIIVINKLRDLAVYPGAGSPDGMVLNALPHYYLPIADVPRVGIVHRLDKDTTGLMVVTKTVPAQTRLVESLQRREITREYETMAVDHMTASGTVDEPISRYPTKRTHMAMYPTGKPAVTHYHIMEHFRVYTRLRLRLETGCMHQIRVYMAHITYPLVGDPAYGGRPRPPKGASEVSISTLCKFDRQSLHTTMLCLYYPISGTEMEWHMLAPQDMMELIEVMHADSEEHKDEVDWLQVSRLSRSGRCQKMLRPVALPVSAA